MLMHLPIVIFASLPFTTVADTVPKFDIARECRAEGGSETTQQRCAQDEAKARDDLQPQWIQFSAADKGNCIRETSIDETPSYVELLICLQMARDAKKSAE
ncbi:hypothetical protein [Bradyrhizobium canariense]|uniref:Uncharacterized protein n=1 Tax=Bradyrhizobium canariense TaxID=255045 RepID=A0A1H1SXZ8_9BRAD|nr:hypothetical protein [Bradyrhizobium canariense]SDS52703.1 hypothetical protein SAMN05444158_2328 [Bradyrhizobium canariense]